MRLPLRRSRPGRRRDALGVCEVDLRSPSGRPDGLRQHGAGAWGAAESARRALAAGAAGAIVPDLPLQEAEAVRNGPGVTSAWCSFRWSRRRRPAERRARICASRRGLRLRRSDRRHDGEREELPASLADRVPATKAEAEVRVAVGFGIGTPAEGRRGWPRARTVIIGSRSSVPPMRPTVPRLQPMLSVFPARDARPRSRQLGFTPHGNGRDTLLGSRRDDAVLRLRAGRPGGRHGLLHRPADRRRAPRLQAACSADVPLI